MCRRRDGGVVDPTEVHTLVCYVWKREARMTVPVYRDRATGADVDVRREIYAFFNPRYDARLVVLPTCTEKGSHICMNPYHQACFTLGDADVFQAERAGEALARCLDMDAADTDTTNRLMTSMLARMSDRIESSGGTRKMARWRDRRQFRTLSKQERFLKTVVYRERTRVRPLKMCDTDALLPDGLCV